MREARPGETCSWCDAPAIGVSERGRGRITAGCIDHTAEGRPRKRMPRGQFDEAAYRRWQLRDPGEVERRKAHRQAMRDALTSAERERLRKQWRAADARRRAKRQRTYRERRPVEARGLRAVHSEASGERQASSG